MPGLIPLSRIVPIALALALSGAGVAGVGMARGDDAAPVLIVTGRVIDAQGQPIPKARVVTGDSRLSATVDASGRYTLTLPLARADVLARYPYALALRAEAKGWTIALPSGDSGLGLELRTVTALDGTNRCFARSNDVRVAAAAARAVGSAKEPAAVTVNFVGEKGDRARGADPELTQTAQVALSALALPPLARDSISVTVTERPVVAPPPPRTPAPAAPPSTTPAPPSATPAAASTPPASETPLPAAAPAASNERSARRAEEKRIAREEKEREKEAKEKRAREEALARIAADAAKESAKGSPIERQEREHEQELERRDAKAQARVAKRQEEERLATQRVERRAAERAAKDAREEARDASRDSTRAAANEVREAKARADATRLAAARLAKANASKPAPAPKDQVAATSVPETPAVEKPPVVEAPRPGVAPPATDASLPPATPAPPPAVPQRASRPATDPSLPRRVVVIHPAPDGEGRVRSAPFVIRSGGNQATEAAAATDSCACRIEGTIEVRSNEPLASRVKVVVSLAWFPAAADTVELFMGSPRAFKLPAAACGPQRLKVTLPGRQRFDVLTRDAVAGFRCDGGPVHQVRIVLGPR